MSTNIHMTIEELQAKSAKSLAALEDKVKERNTAVYDGKSTEDVSKIEREIDELAGEYASYQKLIVFEKCAASDDPMLYAVQHPTYFIQQAKDDKQSKDIVPPLVLEPVERTIDLLQLHKHIPDGIGRDKKWPYIVEAFNSKLTARTAEEIGLNPKEIVDSYAMSSISREIDLGKNPTSNTNLLKTFRSVIASMIGEEYAGKITSHDVAFLIKGYTKKSRKALTLTVANHKTLRASMLDACRHIVNGEEYALDYKRSKESATAKPAAVESQESKPAGKSKKSKPITEGEAVELPAVPAA